MFLGLRFPFEALVLCAFKKTNKWRYMYKWSRRWRKNTTSSIVLSACPLMKVVSEFGDCSFSSLLNYEDQIERNFEPIYRGLLSPADCLQSHNNQVDSFKTDFLVRYYEFRISDWLARHVSRFLIFAGQPMTNFQLTILGQVKIDGSSGINRFSASKSALNLTDLLLRILWEQRKVKVVEGQGRSR